MAKRNLVVLALLLWVLALYLFFDFDISRIPSLIVLVVAIVVLLTTLELGRRGKRRKP